MESVRFIKNRPMTIGGEEHTGWLPAGAATPLPTPVTPSTFQPVKSIDGNGYLLCHESTEAQCRETHGTKHCLMLKMRHKTGLVLRVPNGNQNEPLKPRD